MAETPTVLVDTADGVMTITLNRPAQLNALTRDLRQRLKAALDEAKKAEAVRAVLLAANGRAFCVGQDVGEMEAAMAAGGFELGSLVEAEYVPLVQDMRDLDKPVVACVQGACAGGGLALALAADLRVLSADAKLLPAFVKVAVAPDTGASFFLTRALGLSRALALALTGQAITSQEALAWGLAFEVAPDAEAARARAAALAQELAQGPTRTYAEIRRLLDAAAGSDLVQALALEVAAQRRLGASDDFQEALRAFTEKRAPRFQGR